MAVRAYLLAWRLYWETRRKQPKTNKAAAVTARPSRKGDSSISRLFAEPWGGEEEDDNQLVDKQLQGNRNRNRPEYLTSPLKRTSSIIVGSERPLGFTANRRIR